MRVMRMNQREKVGVSNRMLGIAFWADFEVEDADGC